MWSPPPQAMETAIDGTQPFDAKDTSIGSSQTYYTDALRQLKSSLSGYSSADTIEYGFNLDGSRYLSSMESVTSIDHSSDLANNANHTETSMFSDYQSTKRRHYYPGTATSDYWGSSGGEFGVIPMDDYDSTHIGSSMKKDANTNQVTENDTDYNFETTKTYFASSLKNTTKEQVDIGSSIRNWGNGNLQTKVSDYHAMTNEEYYDSNGFWGQKIKHHKAITTSGNTGAGYESGIKQSEVTGTTTSSGEISYRMMGAIIRPPKYIKPT